MRKFKSAMLMAIFISSTWLTLGATFSTRTALPVQGLATYYNPGIMDRAAYLQSLNHGFTLDPKVIGYVAMLEVADMGRIVCITANNITIGPLQVADVAGRNVKKSLEDRGWVVDMELSEWLALGLPRRPMIVTVSECKRPISRKNRQNRPMWE